MCVLKVGLPWKPWGQVQSLPKATDACSERKREREDGEKENLPLSLFIISTNFFRQGWEEASRTGSCVSGMCPLRHGLGPH